MEIDSIDELLESIIEIIKLFILPLEFLIIYQFVIILLLKLEMGFLGSEMFYKGPDEHREDMLNINRMISFLNLFKRHKWPEKLLERKKPKLLKK